MKEVNCEETVALAEQKAHARALKRALPFGL